mmetsp:Transcript_22439/g.31353  ORF Transcript_22439/g.31353 Transcript_22439/m.31353 type:complete len:219 (-) Transcript_22439:249-905(-)
MEEDKEPTLRESSFCSFNRIADNEKELDNLLGNLDFTAGNNTLLGSSSSSQIFTSPPASRRIRMVVKKSRKKRGGGSATNTQSKRSHFKRTRHHRLNSLHRPRAESNEVRHLRDIISRFSQLDTKDQRDRRTRRGRTKKTARRSLSIAAATGTSAPEAASRDVNDLEATTAAAAARNNAKKEEVQRLVMEEMESELVFMLSTRCSVTTPPPRFMPYIC